MGEREAVLYSALSGHWFEKRFRNAVHLQDVKRTLKDMRGYDGLFAPAEADQVGEDVSLLQGLPQQGAVGHVVREVHCGQQSGDLLGEDGDLQTHGRLGDQPRLAALHGTQEPGVRHTDRAI